MFLNFKRNNPIVAFYFSDLFRSSTAGFYRSFLAVKLAGGTYSGDMEQVKTFILSNSQLQQEQVL
ncbi:hypothetical protein [Chamaesiphon polymorphus]|nr:hypothetical protein [Chamaesiphon polymorphus]